MGKRLAGLFVALTVLTVSLSILDGGNHTMVAASKMTTAAQWPSTTAAASQNDIYVSASINKRTLRAGETAVLSVTVEGIADCDVPEIPSVRDLDANPGRPHRCTSRAVRCASR